MAKQDPTDVTTALANIREGADEELYFDPQTGRLMVLGRNETLATNSDRQPATEMAREGFFARQAVA